MKRRSFLLGAGTLTLSQMLAGCGSSQNPTLRVRLLKNSIPAQLLTTFRRSLKQSATLDFTPATQLKDLFASLETWQNPGKANQGWGRNLPLITPKKPVIADLVTLGDFWLAQAIEQKLIQPLKLTQEGGWNQLPSRWQELVKRNTQGQFDPAGQIWGAPYRWGSTVIIYRRDKFKSLGWTPTDWQDLWREELRDRISLLDQPREVIGLTLKRLGYSYNTERIDRVPELENTLQKLHQQAKFYSSDTYLQPLLIGDTWLAVGWSTDVLSVIKRDRNIAAVVPSSGTALWSDLWVQPAGAAANPLLQDWINFCWESKPATEISLFSRAASPIVVDMKPAELPEFLKTNSVLLPDAQVLDKSEFLFPLPESTALAYRSLWQQIRPTV
ncbi:extracellular solute-binding protein [Coleofasciculus sp. FACHB-1120]|uniref:extracellular solute-binding protein n=1 Tax=Coleofasciculus sp. FACHB-1120 TaxID=2692783 RepID=UPI0016886EA1|nr:extracellular solute-binding protein [Coleofasciculus sp. FACHB-1120]MBD2742900.1 extracellular solute-binding protein [Coleofasciculus sp. FACHB-1120]